MLEQLAERTHLSKSALGSYKANERKDISHYSLIKLVDFYKVSADYILGRSEICLAQEARQISKIIAWKWDLLKNVQSQRGRKRK